jgi:hypothetical protein
MVYRAGEERRTSCETLSHGVVADLEWTYIMVPIAEEGLEYRKNGSGCSSFAREYSASDSRDIQETVRQTVSYSRRAQFG